MFRKITSNRDPKDTLVSELKKEFGPSYNTFRGLLKQITQKYPKFLFAMMVINILLSVILVTTVFRRHLSPPKHILVAGPSGFDKIMQTGEKLKSALSLKHTIDSLSEKKVLSGKDSVLLDSALDQFQKLKP